MRFIYSIVIGEYYTLVKGVKGEPFDSLGRESDLTAGIIL